MKKVLFAAVVGLALCATPNALLAGPPGFYSGGTYVTPTTSPFALGPTTTSYSSYASPYGYRTYNSYSSTPTPWGWNTYSTGGTFVRPYVNTSTYSVYWNPFLNNYQYSYPMGGTMGSAYNTGGARAATIIPGRRVR